MTGLTTTFGKSSDNGIRLAAEEKNKAGGVLGRPVEIKTEDTESSAEKTPQAVLTLIEQDKVVAVLGEVASSRTIRGGAGGARSEDTAAHAGVTNPKVTKSGSYIFRSCFVDDFQGVTIVKFTAADLKLKTGGVIDGCEERLFEGFDEGAGRGVSEIGRDDRGARELRSGDHELQDAVDEHEKREPGDRVFCRGITRSGADRLAGAGVGDHLPDDRRGWVGFGGDASRVGGEAVNGCYFTNHYFSGDPDPKVQDFVKKYKAAYNGEDARRDGGAGYDARRIPFLRRSEAGRLDGRGQDPRRAVAETKDFPGVTGMITIGKNRNASKPGVVLEIKDGKFTMVKSLSRDVGDWKFE